MRGRAAWYCPDAIPQCAYVCVDECSRTCARICMCVCDEHLTAKDPKSHESILLMRVLELGEEG